jgi:CubicO group peptidase (beta-lactamase class C family)
MTRTAATLSEASKLSNAASPHFRVEGRVQRIENATVDPVAAAGSVWSSVADMARWMRMLLNGGRLGPEGPVLLSAETIAEMFTPQAIVGSDAFYPTATLTRPNWTTYGLGWFQADYRGHKVDFHTGSIDGMVAIVGLLRDRRVGVCVLANLDHAEVRHALMYRVFDRYLGGAERDWSRELRTLYAGLADKAAAAREERRAKRVAGTTPVAPLEAYAGTYADPLYGTASIAVRDGRLHAEYGRGFTGPLEHWHYDTFEARWDARWRGTSLLTFGRGHDGRIATLEMNGWRFARQREAAAR